MSFEAIRLDIDASSRVATITLNRPDKLNSFTRAMHQELSAALDQVEASGARALVLTGAGRGFCAGQDLADLDFTPGAMTDLGELIDEHFNPLIRRLQALPLPVIAAVNGTAAGAGANLALACDLVLAARSASFIQAFVKIGLVPDSGGTWFLPQRVGMARALGLAITGDKLGAEKAESWGLIWQTVDDTELAATAGKLAAQLAQQPTRAIAAIKQAMRAGVTQTLDQQLDLERDLQRELGASHDYAEGVQAFPNHPAHMTPDELARATAAAMYENDACSKALGFEIVEVRPGYARLRMAVRDDFLNGHQICHGGLIFTLADSTFAFACNTYNINTVAAGCSIEFLRPVKGGDVLTAEAVEQTLSGRTGIYDIRVTNRAEETVAMFRGKSAQIKGNLIPTGD
ncbi:hypothetical protein KCU90_g4036, partial [Aureobasidium melanogenum]